MNEQLNAIRRRISDVTGNMNSILRDMDRAIEKQPPGPIPCLIPPGTRVGCLSGEAVVVPWEEWIRGDTYRRKIAEQKSKTGVAYRYPSGDVTHNWRSSCTILPELISRFEVGSWVRSSTSGSVGQVVTWDKLKTSSNFSQSSCVAFRYVGKEEVVWSTASVLEPWSPRVGDTVWAKGIGKDCSSGLCSGTGPTPQNGEMIVNRTLGCNVELKAFPDGECRYLVSKQFIYPCREAAEEA